MSNSDYRPIDLCNVIYKVIAKVICNKLKFVVPMLIGEIEEDFLQGKNLIDYTLISLKRFHKITKNQRRQKVAFTSSRHGRSVQ